MLGIAPCQLESNGYGRNYLEFFPVVGLSFEGG
jgi:hypothetical protein